MSFALVTILSQQRRLITLFYTVLYTRTLRWVVFFNVIKVSGQIQFIAKVQTQEFDATLNVISRESRARGKVDA